MTDTAKQIQSLLKSFTHQLVGLIHQDTLQRISETLEEPGGRKTNGRTNGHANVRTSGRANGRTAATRAPAKKIRKASATTAPKSPKRTSDSLAEVAGKIAAWVIENPGQGIEQIAKGVSMDSRYLKLPIKKLIATGHLTTTGQKRGTKYYSAG